MAKILFGSNGELNPGIYKLTISEFINFFCADMHRKSFIPTIVDRYNLFVETGAKNIYVGGSFITAKEKPADIDFLVVYDKGTDIPKRIEHNPSNPLPIDILYCTLEDQKLFDSYINLFAHNKDGSIRGLVQIEIKQDEALTTLPNYVDSIRLDAIIKTYNNRQLVLPERHKGILITIHGLKTKAQWNFDIAPIASSQGWIFAPFVYHNNDEGLLFSSSKRKQTLDIFRDWIFGISKTYGNFTSNISVVAHSYGSYLLGSYIARFDKLPVQINSVILLGSILNRNYDWDKQFNEFKVGRVLNLYSKNDNWVKWMLNSDYKRFIGMDIMFGNAGHKGFICNNKYLFQRELEIIDHTNSIKPDIIESSWMPFLNINANALQVNRFEAAKNKTMDKT